MGKIDPRVVKTRRKLKNAFLSLLSRQSLGEMNVKDLTQTAEVTRGTFYLHYKDKETFIQVMMQELIDEFFEATVFQLGEEGAQYPVVSLVQTFEYVEERPDFFTVLLKEKDATKYRDKMSEQLYEYIVAHQQAKDITNGKIPKELLMNYLMYALLGYIDGWLKDGKIYANHFMASNLQKLLDSELLEEAGLADFFVTDATEIN